MKQLFTHFHRVLPLALFIAFSAVLFTSCEKSEDDTFNPTPKNDLIGNWTIDFSGDINGPLPLGINVIPLSSTGRLPLTIDGVTNTYRLGVAVNESGQLQIAVLDTDYSVGFIRGSLTKNGSGSGTYQIDFKFGPNDWTTLTGNWTASKN